MVPSASIPAVRQNRSKLTETASQALSTAPIGGKAVNGVIAFFMALLSFRGISTPSLPAQGEQRRSSYFNIPRGNSQDGFTVAYFLTVADIERSARFYETVFGGRILSRGPPGYIQIANAWLIVNVGGGPT